MKKISVISPCYNEEDNVAVCCQTVKAIFDAELPGYEREHIFADNASSDRTVAILRGLAAADPAVKVIVNARNFGPFRSTFNALRYATGDATLVMLPVDLQDPPELLPTFVRMWEDGADVVYGVRTNREEGAFMSFIRGRFYWLVNTLSDFEIPRNVAEFQLVDRKVLDAVLQFDDHYPYLRGIIAACGFKRAPLPYTWRVRQRGFSKNRLFHLVDQALNGIFSFTNAPLRACTFLGAGLAALCFLYGLYSVAVNLFVPHLAPSGIATIIASMFFLGGVQLVFIGMLGEYITSIHAQVRRGPMVIERERINVPAASEPCALMTQK